MREEIQWLRPVIISRERPDGAGQAWIIHGYKEGSDQFLMNFGHTGDGDG